MYQRILVPIDGSNTSSKGLNEAIKLAKLTGASVRLIHMVDPLTFATASELYGVYADDVIPRMREIGDQILETARIRVEEQGIKVDSLLFDSSPTRVADTVVEQAKVWNADLIVIGTHGRRGVKRLMLGSDAEQVVRMAAVPVLLIRGSEVEDSSAVTA